MKAAFAVLAALLLVLALGTTAAMATAPAPAAGPATQAAGQSSSNNQTATSDATSTQTSPSNVNIPVRVLSPGNDGAVSQSNDSTAASGAVNLNTTDQSTGQQQAGPAVRRCRPQARTTRASSRPDSTATSTQDHATNYNIPVRVLSPGDDGSVEQSNSSTALSVAANANATDQNIGQHQAGGGSGAPYVQAAGQDNASEQSADSTATSTQDHATNYNIPVRVLSPGNGGTVAQSNDSTALSIAANLNKTGQQIGQHQAGRRILRRTARAGRRPGREQLPGRHLLGDVDAVARDQHEHPGARSEPRERRLGRAVEQLVRRLARAQRERAVPVDLAAAGRADAASVAAAPQALHRQR